MGQLEIQELTISYENKPIVKNLSIEIYDGEMVSLLGPSGVGKTTILKAIAGLLRPDSGKILINGQRIDHLPAEKRDTVLIFQKPLLFPFLDVGQNIGFGLKMAGVNRAVAEKKIDRIIEITGLTGLKKRKIHQLSGGQQQRVALARGLVLEPSILLLDEPLSNLDAELRQQMRDLICLVQGQTGTTMLFVTHDQSEAFAISDRICVLLGGVLRQTGSPTELFYYPQNAEVARFFGCVNFIKGRIENGVFKSEFVSCKTSLSDAAKATGTIRPEDIVLSASQKDDFQRGRVVQVQFEGSTTRLTILSEQNSFTALTLHPEFHKNQTVWLHLPSNRLHIFPDRKAT